MAASPLKSAFAWLRDKAIRLADDIEARNRSKLPATALEKRILLSGTPMITIDGRIATITAGGCADDGSDDIFELEKSGTIIQKYRVTLNGGATADVGLVGAIDEIRIIGSDDNDRFKIHQNSIPLDVLVLDGASGTSDAVEFIAPAAHANFDQIAYTIANDETTVDFADLGSLTTTANILNVESVSESLVATERDVQITASAATVTIEESEKPTTPDVVLEVGANRTVSFETPTSNLNINIDNAAVQQVDIVEFDESNVDLSVTGGGTDVLNVGTTDIVRGNDVSLTSGRIEVQSSLTADNGGSLSLDGNTFVIVEADLQSDQLLEIKDANTVRIDATASRSIQSANSDILINSVGSIELLDGSSTVLLTAGNNVSLSNVAASGSAGAGANLEIQAGGDVNLRSLSLGGATNNGSLKVLFDTDDTDSDTLLVDGMISSVSTIEFAGGTDGDDVVDINHDIEAASIDIHRTENVLIDGASNRTLQALLGDLSIDATSISLNGGSSNVTLIANQNVVLGDIIDGDLGPTGSNLEIQAGGNVNLQSVSLSGSTTDGSLTVSFDTNDTGTDTLLVNGIVSDVSTLQFTGGSDANDIVNINQDITAASIEIRDADNVLIDASAIRSVTATAGNVSIFSNIGEIQFDDGAAAVAINSTGGSVQLGNVDTLGSNLTIDSQSNVTLDDVELNGTGSLDVTFDSDNNEAGILQLNGGILNATSVTFAAGGTGTADRINVAGNITATSGDIDFGNASLVSMDSSSNRTIDTQSGSILANSVSAIQLENGNKTVTFRAGSNVSLADTSDVDAGATAAGVAIEAGGNVNLQSVSLSGSTTDGSLTVSFDTNDTGTDTLLVNGIVSDVSTLQFTGGSDANDIVNINQDITAASIEFRDADNVLIDASAIRSLTAMAGNVSIFSNIGEIQFDEGAAAVAINSTGGSVQLGNVDTLGSNLTIDSQSNVTLDDVELNGTGSLDVTFDSDNNEAGILQLNGGILNATSVTFAAGGTGTGDRINVAGNITATSGDIDFGNASLVSMDSSSNRTIDTQSGSILANSVSAIQLDNGNKTVTFRAGSNVSLADTSDVDAGATAASVAIEAGGNVNLQSVSLSGSTTDGSLTVSFDTNDTGTDTLLVNGIVSDVSTLQFTGGSDANDIVNINQDITAASIEIRDADNVLIDASAIRSLTAMAGNVSIFSNIGEIQFDDGAAAVAINSTGGSVQLGNVDTLGSNLTIDSQSNVTLDDVELNGTGSLDVTFDSDNNEAGILQLNGGILNATSVTFAAGGTGTADRINVAGNITATSGNIDFGNASLVSLDSSSNRTIDTQSGSIIANSVSAIQLDNGNKTVTFRAGSNVSLADTSDVDAGATAASVAIEAGGNVNLQSVSLSGSTTDGSLTVSFDTNDTGTDTLLVNGIVSDVSTLQFTGGSDANDIVNINQDITAASIEIRDADNVLIDASAIRSLTAMAGNVSIFSNIGEIQFDDGTAAVAINSTGGSVQLGNVDTLGSNLTIDSQSNVTLDDVELNGTGSLDVTFDSDNNEAGILQLNGGILNATSVTFAAGGTGTADRINISNDLEVSTGNIEIRTVETINIDSSSNLKLEASVGNVLMDSVGEIELSGGSATISMIAGQSIELASVSSSSPNAADLDIRAGDNVTIQAIDLGGSSSDGALNVAFDTNDGGTNLLRANGPISNVTTLQFSGGTAANNGIDINGNISAQSIEIRSADQVLIDAFENRSLTATAGNVSINQAIGGIELVGGASLVSIESTSEVLLAPVTVSANAGLAIQFDSDSNESLTFSIDGSISGVSELTVSGGGINDNDQILITSNLTTSAGNIDLQNVELVTVDTSVGRTIQAVGGSILVNSVGSIELSGGSATVELIADQNVHLASLSDVGGNANAASLDLQAGGNVNLQSVSLSGSTTDGSLTVSFDTNDTGTDTLLVNGIVSDVSTLQFTGGSDANDIVNINQDITAASIEIRDADNVLIDASAIRSLTAMAGNISIFSNIGEIQFDEGTAAVAINSTGGSVQLGNVDTLGSNLTIDSQSNVTLDDVELNGTGSLDVTFDSDNNEAGILQLNGGILNATSVTFAAGGTGTADRINVAGNITATSGNIDFGNASLVSMDSSSNRTIDTQSGNVLLDSVGVIQLTGGSELISIKAEQNVRLTDVSDVDAGATAASVAIEAGGNVNLQSVSLSGSTTDGSLTVSFDTNDTGTDTLLVNGIVSDVSTLQFTGGSDANDIVNINQDITAASIEIRDADNVLIDASAIRSVTAMAGNVSIFSNIGEIQFDEGAAAVAINSTGGSVQLGNVDTLGSNLTIDSQSNVTLDDVELNGTGSLDVTFDSDNNEAGILQLNGGILNATSVTFAAGGTGTADRINVAGNITATSGNIDFGNASLVSLDSSSNRTIDTQSGNVLLDSVGVIQLTGGSELISIKAEQNVRLTDVSDVGGNANAASLDLQAGGNVNLQSVSLSGSTTDGSLTVSFDTNDTGTDTLLVNGIVSDVSTLQFTGGSDANDVVNINQDITAASIEIRSINTIQIDALGNRQIQSDVGDILIFDSINSIDVNGASELKISSAANANLSSINFLGNGSLDLQIDHDANDSSHLQLQGPISGASEISLSGGGTGTGDQISIDTNLSSSAGNIEISNAEMVTIDATVDRTLQANGGSILFDSVDEIKLAGGSSSFIVVADQDIRLADVTADITVATGASLDLRAGNDVTLEGIDLAGSSANGAVEVAFDTNNSDINTLIANGVIQSVSTLEWVGGSDGNDIVDINDDIAAASIEIRNTNKVLLDASTVRQLSSTNGPVSIFQAVSEIEVNGNSSLTIDSVSNVTLASINVLNNASIEINFDTDNNEAAILRLNGEVAGASSLMVTGSGLGGGDQVNLNGDIEATGGNVNIGAVDLVTIDVSTNREFRAIGGSLSIDPVGELQLIGGANLAIVADNDVRLSDVRDVDGGTAGANLNIQADGDVTLQAVTLDGSTTDGALIVSFDVDNTGAETLSVNGIINSVSSLQLSGGSDNNDIIDLNGDISGGSIDIQSANRVLVDSSNLRQLSSTEGGVSIFQQIEEIRFDGGAADVAINSVGGSLQLGDVTTLDSDLNINSTSNVSLANVDLNNNGTLDVLFDSDDNEAGTIQLSGLISGAAEIKFGGGGIGTNDFVLIAGDLVSSNGNIEIRNIDAISVDASNDRTLIANNGDLLIGNDITLVNGSGLVTLDANNGNVSIESVRDDGVGTAASLTVESDEGISFTNFDLNDGGLSLTFDADDNGSELLSIVGTSIGTFSHLILSGGGSGANDTISIAASLTATNGTIDIRNAELVSIDASVNRAFQANNGNIHLDSGVGRIELTGGDATVSIVSGQDVRLAGVQDAGVGLTGASLSVEAADDIELKSIELAGTAANGSLGISFDTNNSGINSLSITESIRSIGNLQINGGTDLNDVVNLGSDISADSINIQSANQILIDTSLTRRIESVNGDVSLSQSISEIIFNGGQLLTVASNGGHVSLGDISSTDSHLNIESASNVNLNSVDLNNVGALEINFDTDDNEAATFELDGAINGAAALSFSGGGTGEDDTINIKGDLMSSTGNIEIENAEFIRFDTAVDRLIESNDGDVRFGDDITLVNGSGLLTIRSNDGEVDLDGVRTDATPGVASSLTVESDGGISIGDVNLNGGTDGRLELLFDADNNGSETASVNGGSIENVSEILISGGGTGTGDSVIIAADLSTTNGSIELKNSSLVSLDASANRSLLARNGNVSIFQDIGTIQLIGGSQTVKIDSHGTVELGDVIDVGLFNDGASLEIVSNRDITLQRVELAGLSTDGELKIRFDQDDLPSAGVEFAALNGAIQDVESISIDGGATGFQNEVRLNGNLHASDGDIEFRNIESVTSDSTPTRRMQADGGDLRFAGVQDIEFDGGAEFVAGIDFDLGNDADLFASSDISINAGKNLFLRTDSVLRVTNAASTITGIAGETVVLENGATVMRPLGNGDQVVISNLPPDVVVGSPVLANGISNIDRLGQAKVQVEVGEVNVDRNFTVTGRDPENGDILFSTSNLAGPSVAGAFEFPLQFDFITGVTSLSDQDVVVTYQSDRNNQIVFVANGETLTSRDVTVELRGPLDGLISAITIESPEVPDLVSVTQVEEIPFETTIENLNDVAEVQVAINNNSESEVEQERKYVLRLVTTDETGEEKEIEIGDLSNDALDQEKLPQLFESLPDDRYRIYLILEDGSEQSVLDVNIRDQQAVEVESEDEILQFKKIDIDMESDQPMNTPDDSAKHDFDRNLQVELQDGPSRKESETTDEFILIGKIPVDLRAG